MFVQKKSKEFRKKRDQHGFTLVELLMYVGIASGVLLAASVLMMDVLDWKIKLTAINNVNQYTRFSFEIVTRSIHNATSIQSPASGTSSSTLVLETGMASTTPTRIYVDSGIVFLQEGSADARAVTPEGLYVEIDFRNMSYPAGGELVQTTATTSYNISSLRKEYREEQVITTTTNIYGTP